MRHRTAMSAGLRRVGGALAAAALLALWSCGGDDLPPTTGSSLTIQASDSINPTAAGAAAPVVVRVFQLADKGTFMEADFFKLFDDPTGTLGSDLLARSEYELIPGQRVDDSLSGPSGVMYIGVIAGFRDITNSTWRIVTQVEQGSSDNRIIVSIDSLAISFTKPDTPFWQNIVGLPGDDTGHDEASVTEPAVPGEAPA